MFFNIVISEYTSEGIKPSKLDYILLNGNNVSIVSFMLKKRRREREREKGEKGREGERAKEQTSAKEEKNIKERTKREWKRREGEAKEEEEKENKEKETLIACYLIPGSDGPITNA